MTPALPVLISRAVLGSLSGDGDLPAYWAWRVYGLVAFNQVSGLVAWVVLLAVTVIVFLGRQVRLFFRPGSFRPGSFRPQEPDRR